MTMTIEVTWEDGELLAEDEYGRLLASIACSDWRFAELAKADIAAVVLDHLDLDTPMRALAIDRDGHERLHIIAEPDRGSVLCPGCGRENHHFHTIGSVGNPPEWHALCWRALEEEEA